MFLAALLAVVVVLALPASVSADPPVISVSDVVAEATRAERGSGDVRDHRQRRQRSAEVVCSRLTAARSSFGGRGRRACIATDLRRCDAASTIANFTVKVVRSTTAPVVTVTG